MADSAVVERDPRYPTWEAERVALVTREAELESLIDAHGVCDPEATFHLLMAEGWDEDHCQKKAEEAEVEHEAELQAMRDELRVVRARKSIIGPLAKLENAEKHRALDKGEYQERLFGYLDRIATALELLAGCHKSNGRKRKTASVTN